MLGDFITRFLILILGYAYPGFECYKTVEKNRIDIEELRFWCKYWIIVAVFTVAEKFVDIFISWLPFYGESKIVLFIYLWYPKTKGTGYIYETVLRPLVSRHENDIDRKILEWKARSWDYIIFYWQFVAQYGSGAFFQALQYMASQSMKFSSNINSNSQKKDEQCETTPSTTTQQPSSINKLKQNPSLSRSKKWPPSPPSSPNTNVMFHRKKNINVQSEDMDEDEANENEGTIMTEDDLVRDRINKARARLRRLDSSSQSNTPRTPQRRNLS